MYRLSSTDCQITKFRQKTLVLSRTTDKVLKVRFLSFLYTITTITISFGK